MMAQYAAKRLNKARLFANGVLNRRQIIGHGSQTLFFFQHIQHTLRRIGFSIISGCDRFGEFRRMRSGQ